MLHVIVPSMPQVTTPSGRTYRQSWLSRRPGAATGLAALVFAIAIAGAYAGGRAYVFGTTPIKDFAGYVDRQMVICYFRVIAVLATFLAIVGFWPGQWLMKRTRPFRDWHVWIGGGLGVFVLNVLPMATGTLRDVTSEQLVSIFTLSFIVSAFEEIHFRGLTFRALDDLHGRTAAVFGTAILFTALHVGSQPLAYFPALFGFSVVLGVLRAKGASLQQLIMLHMTSHLPMLTNGTFMRENAEVFWVLGVVELALAFGLHRFVRAHS